MIPPNAVLSSIERVRRNTSRRYNPRAKAVRPTVSDRISASLTTPGCTAAPNGPVLSNAQPKQNDNASSSSHSTSISSETRLPAIRVIISLVHARDAVPAPRHAAPHNAGSMATSRRLANNIWVSKRERRSMELYRRRPDLSAGAPSLQTKCSKYMFTSGKPGTAYETCLAGAPKPLGSGRRATPIPRKLRAGRNQAMLLRHSGTCLGSAVVCRMVDFSAGVPDTGLPATRAGAPCPGLSSGGCCAVPSRMSPTVASGYAGNGRRMTGPRRRGLAGRITAIWAGV